MNLLERVKDLCAENGISQRKLEIDLGLSNGASSKWNKSSPSGEILDKIADYFGVTTDYILGRTDYKYITSEKNNKPQQEDEDIELIQRAHKKMDPKQREKMMRLLKLSFDDLFDEDE